MKKVININFQGRVIPIEELAFEILNQYIDSLRRYFANEEGKEEIINDIESRIAELFGETLKKGATCISEDDVQNIINSMGRPEDFDDDEAKVQAQLGGKDQNAGGQQYTANGHRRLFRDEKNKVLGGVCSGLANYFGLDPLVIRILAVVTLGLCFVPYLVLWIAVPSSATQVIGSARKRLFRDVDDKLIGGVASGLGHYFGVNVWVPRVIFLIPFLSFVARWSHIGFFDFPHFISLSFSPGATITYIILWLILPEAITSADKLEMKGESVNLNSIKNTIQADMVGFRGRAEKFGEEIKTRAEEIGKEYGPRAKQFGAEAYAAARPVERVGGVIGILVKIFAYFILGVVLFATVSGLFALGIVCFGLAPAFEFVLTDGWQSILAWVGVILCIWLPIIGIITWVVRRFAKAKRNSGLMRYTFISLWLIGLASFIALFVLLLKDFKYKNAAAEEKVQLSNPSIGRLDVQLSGYGSDIRGGHWLKLEPFEGIDSDTVFVPNTDIRIIRSTSDSFEVTVLKASNGSSKLVANTLANKITYAIKQKDSTLSLYKGIPINKNDKFRNQRIIITIAVPVGKRILIGDKINWRTHIDFGSENNDWNWHHNFYTDNEDMEWETDVEYVMTTKGLKALTKKFKDNDNDQDRLDRIEEQKNNREQLKQDIEEQQREIEERKKELQQELEEKQKEIEEKKKELNKNVNQNTTKQRRYFNYVAIPTSTTKDTFCSDKEITYSRLGLIGLDG